jgi:hypothetical protein
MRDLSHLWQVQTDLNSPELSMVSRENRVPDPPEGDPLHFFEQSNIALGLRFH